MSSIRRTMLLDLALVALDHRRQALRREGRGVVRARAAACAPASPGTSVLSGVRSSCDDHRHEVVAHAAPRAPARACVALQLLHQRLLLAARSLQRVDLALQRLALAVQVDEDAAPCCCTACGVQRLVQEVDRAALVALEGVVQLAAGGADEDDRDVPRALGAAHQLGQLEAVHAGHLHVEDRQRELVLQQQRQRLLARARLVDACGRRRGSAPPAPAGFPAGRRRSAACFRHQCGMVRYPVAAAGARISRSGSTRSGAWRAMAARGMVGDLRPRPGPARRSGRRPAWMRGRPSAPSSLAPVSSMPASAGP